nr:bifunctional aspartate transaminase/aspartate 4-decarboxylase [uncultured Ligilactobacillus sp.]
MTDVKKEKALEKLGAFEIAFKMLILAKNNDKQNVFLNAGRGNPNWIQTISRAAFARLIQFGIKESKRTISDKDLAGYTEENGIYERLETFLQPDENKEDKFLLDCVNYVNNKFNFNKDDFVKEWIDGVLGNNYPVPSRILKYTEKVINEYLDSILYHNNSNPDLKNNTELFATEGATAAIVYIFNSLKENKLIHPGDKIIINTPIFTPYIEIPELADYDMDEIDLRSKECNNWELDPEAIKKLQDPNIKALFLVNPSNPGSVALDQKALKAIKKAVEINPNLMIITDDVYGPFTEKFESVYTVAPHNTLLVYSYSKLFGVTGWRIGVIAANKVNIFDKLISKLPENEKKELFTRYRHVVLKPEEMKFIDRMVADSRAIGLYHTSGLSTPQQIMLNLFSLAHLINEEKDGKDRDHYIEEAKKIVTKRYDDLHKGLSVKEFNDPSNARYYSLIDIYELAEQYYDKDFSNWLRNNFEQIDFLMQLSKKNGVVLMDGVGFGSKPGVLRVSQANLPNEDYAMIARQIRDLMEDYHNQYLKRQK